MSDQVIDVRELKKAIVNELLKEIRWAIKEAVKEALEEYYGRRNVTISDFERVYEFTKDGLCMASIEDLRIQLGLSLEEFMARFRDHILQNYELISGGKEGFVKGGVLYGIIRRKDYSRGHCPKVYY